MVDRLAWKRRQQIQADNSAKLAMHREALKSWLRNKAKFEEEEPLRRRAAETLVYFDILVMHKVLAQRLQSLAWPLPTKTDFILREEGSSAALTISISGAERLPAQYATPAPDLLSFILKKLDPETVQLHVFRYAYSVLFRTVGEVFATLPTVKVVTAFCRIPCEDASFDPLIAVQVSKQEWMRFNFARLDRMDTTKQLVPFVRKGFSATRLWRPAA
ncbi:hypothetical protein AU476_12720 [Cupriavidus sp. UYMSc13B]|nr:hypothetical protein AU476_12720 [Cupriavidus sp. UYMSc13B]